MLVTFFPMVTVRNFLQSLHADFCIDVTLQTFPSTVTVGGIVILVTFLLTGPAYATFPVDAFPT